MGTDLPSEKNAEGTRPLVPLTPAAKWAEFLPLAVICLVYATWLNARGVLTRRHVNTGLAHYVCLSLLSLWKAMFDRSRPRSLLLRNLVMNGLFIFFLAHFNGFWCYTHPRHKARNCEKLHKISAILKADNVPWTLDKGSLLGAIRDYPSNGFGILWEKDEDIRIGHSRVWKAIADIQRADPPWFHTAVEATVDVRYGSVGETVDVPYCGARMPVDAEYTSILRDAYGAEFMTPKKVTARIGISRAIGCGVVEDSWIHHRLDDAGSIAFFILYFANALVDVFSRRKRRVVL